MQIYYAAHALECLFFSKAKIQQAEAAVRSLYPNYAEGSADFIEEVDANLAEQVFTNPHYLKVFDYLSEFAEQNGIKTSDILSDLGYDGVHDGAEWVAFRKNQVKSADEITYDDNGNPISEDERYDEGNDDIRYSLFIPAEEVAADVETIERPDSELAAANVEIGRLKAELTLTDGKAVNTTALKKLTKAIAANYSTASTPDLNRGIAEFAERALTEAYKSARGRRRRFYYSMRPTK